MLQPLAPSDAARFDRLADFGGCLHTLSIADRSPLSELLAWTQLPHIAPWIAALTDILAHSARQRTIRSLLTALETPGLPAAHTLRLATSIIRLLHPPVPRRTGRPSDGADRASDRSPSPGLDPRPAISPPARSVAVQPVPTARPMPSLDASMPPASMPSPSPIPPAGPRPDTPAPHPRAATADDTPEPDAATTNGAGSSSPHPCSPPAPRASPADPPPEPRAITAPAFAPAPARPAPTPSLADP